MEFLQKVFNNPQKTIIAIVIVLSLFLGYKAFAGEVEVGPTWTSGLNGGVGLTFSERVFEGVDLGVALISEQTYKGETIGNNGNVWLAYVAERPAHWWAVLPSDVSIGAAYHIQTSRLIGCHQGFLLGMKWRFGDWGVGIRHWSNAGVCERNRGQDLLTFSYRF
jgi:hypothetical protein